MGSVRLSEGRAELHPSFWKFHPLEARLKGKLCSSNGSLLISEESDVIVYETFSSLQKVTAYNCEDNSVIANSKKYGELHAHVNDSCG